MSRNQKKIDIILSVVVAIALWIFVVNTVNPSIQDTVRNVPIEVVGQEKLLEKNLVAYGLSQESCSVVVFGSRNDVKDLTSKDVKVYADVSDLAPGVNTVKLTATTPENVSVVELQANIMINADVYVSENKPVTVSVKGAGAGEEVIVHSCAYTQMEVSGAKTVVDSVTEVKVSADLSGRGLEEKTEFTLTPAALDAHGDPVNGVTLAQKTVKVVAGIYQIKSVALNVAIEGSVWEGAVLEDVKLPETIKIKGPASRLSQISSIKVKAINLGGLYESTDIELDPALPDGVYLAEGADLGASIIISENGELKFSYAIGDVVVNNVGSGLSADVTLAGGGKIAATVKGPVSTLRTLAAGDIAPSVDASAYSQGTTNASLTPLRDIEDLSIEYEPKTVTLIIH